ncbi:MAG TPA: hypothetical protein VKA21_07370 [Candidatus Binatia bacterium]|nr:hypothetical protein [Candidatus Binatia bacterium]
MRIIPAVLALAAALGGVASAEENLPPRRKPALLAWLQAGAYRLDYVPEPAVHPSAGPHGAGVLTWYGPILVDDLRAARTRFTKGAAIVKELYDADGALVGWAAMRKVRRRSGSTGRGWLFYETFDLVHGAGYYGRGHPTCAGCHRQGVDYLRSTFRP